MQSERPIQRGARSARLNEAAARACVGRIAHWRDRRQTIHPAAQDEDDEFAAACFSGESGAWEGERCSAREACEEGVSA
jgi:hypothetical protein